MIVLDSTTDNLQIVLGFAVTTNQLQCVSTYRDITTTGFTPGRTVTNTNNTTDVNLVTSPASSTQRIIDTVSIFNNDTVVANVIVKYDDNGTEYKIADIGLSPNDRLEYSNKTGRRVFNSRGSLKSLNTVGNSSTGSGWKVNTVASDQTITQDANASMYKIGGLSFKMDPSAYYFVRVVMVYAMSSTNDGIGISVLLPPTTSGVNKIFLRTSKPSSTTAEILAILTGALFIAPTLSSTSASENIVTFEGLVGGTSAASGGYFNLYLRNDTSGGVTTIRRGSVIYYNEVL